MRNCLEVVLSIPSLLLTFRLAFGCFVVLCCGVVCRYALPREKGIFKLLPSPSATSTRSIIQRIVDNRAAFEARNAKKVASEAAYYQNSKDYVKEL